MELRFDTQVAEALSIHEAIFLGWLQHTYQGTPIQMDELENLFAFWKDEVIFKVMVRLEERGILQAQRDKQGFYVFALDANAYQQQTGCHIQTSNLPATNLAAGTLLDGNLKKHLQRFQGTDSVLNKKLTELIQQHTAELLQYAQEEGLSIDVANASLDKFLHYVASNPDRFWNSDLIAYWRFWVSNTKEKTGTVNAQGQNTGGGKRAAIERSVQHAADNWLKKKAQDDQIYRSVKITHE